MRSRLLVTAFALAVTGVVASCDDEITGIDENFEENATWEATLNGANERPNPTTTSATGRALFIDNGTTVTYFIEYSGLNANTSNAHIHRGTAEQAGGVLIQLPFVAGQTSGTVIGTIDMTAADVSAAEAGNQSPADLRALFNSGGVYVNIHSAPQPPGYTAGEIRGQIRPVE
jgi:hypothetical protein